MPRAVEVLLECSGLGGDGGGGGLGGVNNAAAADGDDEVAVVSAGGGDGAIAGVEAGVVLDAFEECGSEMGLFEQLDGLVKTSGFAECGSAGAEQGAAAESGGEPAEAGERVAPEDDGVREAELKGHLLLLV